MRQHTRNPLITVCLFSGRIQELDGSFFEKFGTLLKQQHAEEEDGGMAPVREEQEPGNVELELDVPENNRGPGMALQDSDSEPEESDKNEFITDAMGWNVSLVVLVKHYFH